MFFLVVPLVLSVALVALAFRLRRNSRPRKILGRFALICLALLVTSSCAGVGIGLYQGMTAVGGELIDPSQKARVLAEGISEAMNCGAFAILVFFLPTALAFVMFLRSPKVEQP